MEVDKWVESEKIENNGLERKKLYEGCIKCLELYDKITQSDANCIRLELDIGEKNTAIHSLECKLEFMLKNRNIENEFRMLKQKNEELENSILNRKAEDDKVTQLMIENSVLECEKKKAETDMVSWKAKCEELEMQVMELEKKLSDGVMKSGGPSGLETWNKANDDIDESGTHPMNTPSKQCIESKGFTGGRRCESKSRVRNCLNFGGEWSPHNNISPSTPGIRHPFVPIEISDSDEDNVSRKYDRTKVRKRVASCVVTTESESDSDDNIPIGTLRSRKRVARSSDARQNDSGSEYNRKKHTRRRRLKRVGENEDKDSSGLYHDESTENGKILEKTVVLNNHLSEDETEDDSSCSEGENLGGFIVDGSDASESESNGRDCSGDSGNGSESSVGYDELISSLRRERKGKTDWDSEGNMLADLGKYHALCLKGVCAIYRRQTSEERCSQATIFKNGRGFSQIHAFTGSYLAEFLTDGDPQGDVKKSMEELEEYYPNGVEKCIHLSTNYSKQLFEIYQNREDPFFHP